MKRLVLIIIPALICGAMFISCDSKVATDDNIIKWEPISDCNGCTLPQENLPWLKRLIDLSKTDKTMHYYGRIWIDNFNGHDIFVTNMMLGSGGVMYYFFDCSGSSIIVKGYEKHHNPWIEAFAGKQYGFIEVEKEALDTYVQHNIKLDVVVHSSY